MSPRPVVVYTDPPWALDDSGAVDPSRAVVEREVFAERYELRFAPAAERRYDHDGPAFAAAVAGAAALAIYRYRVTPRTLDLAGESLRVVGRQGVGFDNLSEDLLKAEGVVGFHIPDYCVDEVTAHTLALLLALERRIVPQHNGLTGGRFDIYAGGVPRRLQGLTAGILGFGRIGRAVANRLRLFYGQVLACDPYVSADLMAAYGVRRVDQATLLASSDVVTLHCLLDDETEGIVGADALAAMKPTALLINAARGKLVDGRALYEALAAGRVGGAGIDVFSPEDPHQDEWYRRVVALPNVVVTSHRAFLSVESETSQRRRTAEGIRQVLETGRPPADGHRTEGLTPRH